MQQNEQENFIEKLPARIHVLMAGEADYAVVIRRGPSGHVCTAGWNLTEDTFTLGQWLKGRIDERISDLSPDGKHLIYFAKQAEFDTDIEGNWTAISIAPYLKPLGLWKRSNTWGGGGRFISNTKYWINKGKLGHTCIMKPDGLKEARFPSYKELFREDWYWYEKKGGWSDKKERPEGNDRIIFFEKNTSKNWVIIKKHYRGLIRQQGKGCHYNAYELFNRRTKKSLSFPDWEWAETREGRLYWAEKGKLCCGLVDDEGVDKVKELYDFNDMTFKSIKAPY